MSHGKMTFAHALMLLQDESVKCSGMRRACWMPDVVVHVQRPDEHSKMTAPYLYVSSRYGCVPWIPNMIEMFADDYIVLE